MKEDTRNQLEKFQYWHLGKNNYGFNTMAGAVHAKDKGPIQPLDLVVENGQTQNESSHVG